MSDYHNPSRDSKPPMLDQSASDSFYRSQQQHSSKNLQENKRTKKNALQRSLQAMSMNQMALALDPNFEVNSLNHQQRLTKQSRNSSNGQQHMKTGVVNNSMFLNSMQDITVNNGSGGRANQHPYPRQRPTGDRNQYQLVSQSVQSSSNLRGILNQQEQQLSQNISAYGGESLRPAGSESTTNIRQMIAMQKQRHCKTTSPTGGNHAHFMTHEARLRKKSREIVQKKREGFADLLVILGLKYNEFVVDSYPDLNIKEVAKEHNYADNLIWELFLCEKMGAFIVPKSLCIISAKPIFSLQKQLLTLIFQKVILPYNSASIQASQQPPANYIWYLNDLNEELIKKNPDGYLMQRIEFYITVFFNHLYYCEEVENDIEIQEIRERYTPALAPIGQDGHKKKGQKKRIVESFFRYRNTKTYGFTLENFSFELLLQTLKPEKIIFLITALLLERKIILIKDNFGDTAVIMESLISLLNPLKWNFVFITYLTPKLVECLEAPFPYIIGVSRKIWEDHCLMREYPEDMIVFDLDNQEKLSHIKEELPPLPQPQANVLERSLKELLDFKDRFIEVLEKNTPQKLSKDKIDEYYWAYAQLRVKQSFFNFFLLTINNYIGYFKNLDEEGDLSPNKKDKKCMLIEITILDYDKLSSIDVFDFDNYLNQFQGENKEFMEKLMRTQSFNNFIEETYKNTSPKSHIGFFKTNFEVIIEHSFKKLKKEQNKLIDITLLNLYNPVKFTIHHMFRQYKMQIMQKNADKLKKLIEEEGDRNEEDQQLDMFLRQDLFEKLLSSEIEGNSKKQLSILNSINQDIMTEMPGIQYEHINDHINTYEHKKSQRSDGSQDIQRFHHNKTVAQLSCTGGFEFQQRIHNNSQQLSETKSRNFNYVAQSRSGDNIRQIVQQTAPSKGGQVHHQRNGGGVIYKNYLSMADNKNLTMLQEEDLNTNSIQNATTVSATNAMLTQEFELRQLSMAIGTKTTKHNNQLQMLKNRVQSENSFLKGLGNFAMNKTVIVNSNQHLHRANTTIQNIKSNTLRTPTAQILNQTTVKDKHGSQQLDKTRFTSSPRIMYNHKKHHDSANIQESTKKTQQTVLKEALNRKIMHERSKHGLQMKSEERNLNGNRLKKNSSLTQSQVLKSPAQGALSFQIFGKGDNQGIGDIPSTMKNNDSKKVFEQGLIKQNVPKTNIDLMNPKKTKKISRNEERKLAQKRGFLGFEQHDSFYQFYSPKEELYKLAKMQQFKKISANQTNDSKDNSNFTQFIQQNYHSNGSDDDKLQQILQQQSTQNKIVFQKRTQTFDQLPSNDPLATTINFHSNFIQQKPHLYQQSPSINTEMSSLKKGQKPVEDNQQLAQEFLENENFMLSPVQADSSNYEDLILSQSKIQDSLSPVHPKIIKNTKQIKPYKQVQPHSRSQDHHDSDKLGKEYTVKQMQKLNQNSNKYEDEVQETRPLQINDSKQAIDRKNKQEFIRGSESPQIFTGQSQNNLSFKHFINSVQGKQTLFGNSVNQSKDFKQVSHANKSPKQNMENSNKFQTQNSRMISKELQGSKNLQTSTFDNITQRVDLIKPNSANILSRKRSQPTFNEKNQSSNHKISQTNQSLQSKGINTQKHQQQQSYFKQRPAAHHQKSTKSTTIPINTIQIDLEKQEKLAPSRMGIEKEMASLRISPIPNLALILHQQKLQKTNSVDEESKHNSCNINNRSSNSLQHPNHFHLSKHAKHSSNFQSRQSESDQQLNQNETPAYQSVSQLIEQDIFDKAQLAIGGPQSTRHNIQYQAKFKNKIDIKGNKAKDQSLRSSSTNNQIIRNSRMSNLSIGTLNRPSQLSLVADLQRQENEMNSAVNSARQSDLQSQNEASHNISLTMMKSSPRLFSKAAQKMSGTSIHSQQKNFILQEGTTTDATKGLQSQSQLTSCDAQNMQSLLNALRNQMPLQMPKQEKIIGVKQYDEEAKIILSPIVQVQQKNRKEINSIQKSQPLRTSSIDEINSMEKRIKRVPLDLSQHTPHIMSSKDRGILSHSSIQTKQVKSPQPSSNIISSNPYLKSLQSQEFQLKEKARKKNLQTFSTLQQSGQDPVISLQRDSKSAKMDSKYYTNVEQNQNHGKQQNNSSVRKQLNMDNLNEESEVKQSYFSNSSTRRIKPDTAISQTCRSTKNLYGAFNKAQIIDEINDIDEALVMMELSKKRTISQNILEDALTSKSRSSSSYQTSPKVSLIRQQPSLVNQANMHFQASQRLTAPPMLPPSGSLFRTQGVISHSGSNKEEGQIQITQQMMPTVRNNEFPVKKISFQEREAKNQYQSTKLEDQQQMVVVDFPRQISDNTLKMPQQRSGQSSIADELSLHFEIIERNTKTQKNKNRKQSKEVFQAPKGNKSNHVISQQPLNEIRYNSNEDSSISKQIVGIPDQKFITQGLNHKPPMLHHNRPQHTENSSQIVATSHVTSSRHSHAITSDKLPHDFMKLQKKRQLRHGFTTCIGGQNAKESQQYVRRDLNQDTFCKINSHHGDLDNDPHTPKSSGSMGSIEKKSNKKRKKQLQEDFQSLVLLKQKKIIEEDSSILNIIKLQDQQSRQTPLRFQSQSVDDITPPSNFLLETVHPLMHHFQQQPSDFASVLLPSELQQKESRFNNTQTLVMRTPQEGSAIPIIFEDGTDLKDTDDKFTSRDINFNRMLKQQLKAIE